MENVIPIVLTITVVFFVLTIVASAIFTYISCRKQKTLFFEETESTQKAVNNSDFAQNEALKDMKLIKL